MVTPAFAAISAAFFRLARKRLCLKCGFFIIYIIACQLDDPDSQVFRKPDRFFHDLDSRASTAGSLAAKRIFPMTAQSTLSGSARRFPASAVPVPTVLLSSCPIWKVSRLFSSILISQNQIPLLLPPEAFSLHVRSDGIAFSYKPRVYARSIAFILLFSCFPVFFSSFQNIPTHCSSPRSHGGMVLIFFS